MLNFSRCDRTIILDFSITGTTCIAQEKVDKKEYVHHAFPEGFKAHWVRVTSDTDGVITAFYLSII